MPQILLVKTSSMGDVIHNFPVIADIRAHYPDAQFDWMVEESFAEIPLLHPLVSHVIPVSVRRWRKSLLGRNTWQEIANLKKRLKHSHYDLIIDTQGLLKSGVLTRFAHGKTHGMNCRSAREPIASIFYDFKHEVPRHQHAVSRNRALAALALNYPIPSSAPDYGLTSSSLQPTDLALPNDYVVALHGTSRDSKLWPISHWVALASHLESLGLSLVLPWSNSAEEARAKAITAQSSNALLLPKLKLTPLTTILAHAKVNIGVDTGLMHLSTALNKPSIAIYTDTDPEYTGVLGQDQNIAINIGGKAQIPNAEDVFSLASKLISKGKP
ncbi:MAG: lipopolysaccharide heptosyltransferase I [Methylotenera sp.]|uniref:lipopolysaccharide heptosyltransferase I n=1 Tax=Methylotenera sp. TaxID=2051956 RepID=UPI000D4FB480|nr:lipopolysaccharide heptosyltransferase I [Methylotenera sp.]PPC83307.1 MAG: lipopolysaccharide heptosyltransferase I [Methylotenera sp.]